MSSSPTPTAWAGLVGGELGGGGGYVGHRVWEGGEAGGGDFWGKEVKQLTAGSHQDMGRPIAWQSMNQSRG